MARPTDVFIVSILLINLNRFRKVITIFSGNNERNVDLFLAITKII